VQKIDILFSGFLQVGLKLPVIGFGEKDPFSFIASAGDMIERASIFYSCNRSQVQGSTFRVKNKESIENPKPSLKMLIFPNNCQFGYKFCNFSISSSGVYPWPRPVFKGFSFMISTYE